MQQRGSDGAIDAAGHTYDYTGGLHWLWYHSFRPHFGQGALVLDPETLSQRAVDVLSEHKGLDIALIDISKNATFTDYFVIATAQSPLQFNALAEYLERDLKPQGHDLRHKEGTPESGWMLLDFGDIIVHIFSPDQREYYRLEELWGRTSPVVRFAD
ncbi:MAG TPA: ribosome silencing factor [Tepidiformaceae bacterium]|nr:ribosome silencing factor [Tepidiformaceae bacterium]